MVEAMSKEVVGFIPPVLGPYMAPITALLSLPFTFFISNDAFYFGMFADPGRGGAHYGVSPMAIARASLMGQPVHLLSRWCPRLICWSAWRGSTWPITSASRWCPRRCVCVVMTLVGMGRPRLPLVG